jgi:cytochrome c-type biogenesis protein CcmE
MLRLPDSPGHAAPLLPVGPEGDFSMQNSTIVKLALTVAVIAGGVFFFARSTQGSTQHYKMVDQLLATDLSQWKDKELKVHGWVVAGTIKEKVVNQETMRTFVMHKDGKKIRVFSRGPKPDTFKDQSEVVATGRIVTAQQMDEMARGLDIRIEDDMPYVVEASELMAKCPSKYEGANANKNIGSGESGPEFKAPGQGK